ncbi:MAG: SAM-dependent chlorinase/fluorinase [Phycisphaerae bacterium]|nr:SAM-dependent chlorinase/fluorinase [Phycisphaerae bacterium]
MAIITLTTDFGDSDHYVACMRGVVLQISPDALIVDVTHRIRRHDVVHAAFVLRQAFEHFPRGTIHVAVVDPGVGTTRRLLATLYAGQVVLAPDNGVVSLIHRDYALSDIRSIENERLFRREVSATFHGRDILAPVAAYLASGVPLSSVGPAIDQLEILNLPRALMLPDGGLEGQVLFTDSFGNLVTNISQVELERSGAKLGVVQVYVGPLRVGPIRRTYAEVEPGGILALIGSTGAVEIAINQGSAAERLRAAPGTSVIVR